MAAYKSHKKKEIIGFLGQIQDFDRLKLREDLEQYITPPQVACEVLNWIESEYGDISRKFVVDLGSGTGMLSLGCSFMGAAHVVGLEVDEEAMRIAQDNLKELGRRCGSVDFVRCDVLSLRGSAFPLKADTVVMNPPFGVHVPGFDYKEYRKQNRGAKHHHQKPRKSALSAPPKNHPSGEGTDMLFLQRASEILSDNGSIYAFLLGNVNPEKQKHRQLAEKYLEKRAHALNLTATFGQVLYNLPATYHHHRDSERDIQVYVIRFRKVT